MSELDDLLMEMLAESEASKNQSASTRAQQQQQQTNSNAASSNSNVDKRKSRLSQHPQQDSNNNSGGNGSNSNSNNNNGNEGGFDYLDTLLNDMSDESIRNSIKPDNTRIKSLRLTSTFDLESTLKDLEETFMKDSNVQNKRKPSTYINRPLSPPPGTGNSNNSNSGRPLSNHNLPPPPLSPPPNDNICAVVDIELPPPPPPITSTASTTTTTTLTAAAVVDEEEEEEEVNDNEKPKLKRVSSERAVILTKEAIDAADLLDQMIESFGVPETPPKKSNSNSNSNSNKQQQESNLDQLNINLTKLTKSPNSTIRPASKLNAPVDIQVSSPKAPTPIPTLSSPPISPNSQNSDQLLDEMITLFKESNSNIKYASQQQIDAGHVVPKTSYLSQQHYPLSVEEQQIQTKVKPLPVDEEIIEKILGDQDIDNNGMVQSINSESSSTSSSLSSSSNNVISNDILEKAWYIKPVISESDKIIGSGNHGTTSRAGVHKEKRIVSKSWTFVTPQATPILFNEIEHLMTVKHPNLLPLVGASFDNNFTTFTEYVTGNNLDLVIKNLDEKNELQLIVRLAEEIASAMAFLHSLNIVHRSLHPKNILLNSDLKVYIKDFGFTLFKDETLKKKFSTPLKSQIVHSQYLAPELYNVLLGGGRGGYDTKVDVFSFGVLLWEMFARDIKLSDLKSTMVNGYTHYSRPTLDNCPFTIEKLIRLCISTDPNVRPSFSTILKILRQPLHTLQRFNKPEQAQQQSSFNNTNVDSQLETVSALANTANTNNSNLDPVKREKLSRIYQACKDLMDTSTLVNLTKAAQTIEAICKNEENHPFIVDLNFIPLILQLLENRFEDIQLICLKSLTLIIENVEIATVFRNLLGVNILIELLSNRSENLLFASLRLLAQYCQHSDAHRVESMNKGAITILINQLTHHNEAIKLQVIWCISLMLESTLVQEEFIKLNGVDILVDMFVYSTNNGFDLRVASALSKLTPLKQIQDQLNNGHYRERILKKYIQLLADVNFETLRLLGLESIASLISLKDNQDIVVAENIVPFLFEYLDVNTTNLPPQMTALKIILVLAVNSQHISYLKENQELLPIMVSLKDSPHPSIQKASEKVISLMSR
ncbi:hypothetical protein CYY_004673 [Polysphondylium violaceum]|uniref:Protein kinase domain-containing protein n=1 Tax=Polysphondylium violaceum TaxID=133409 RepID=A0A8J4PW53_9MYCE|nr:hypothetical protein CYY_004673 [Polysphondylium violaceum]